MRHSKSAHFRQICRKFSPYNYYIVWYLFRYLLSDVRHDRSENENEIKEP